jgi:hypothetical protein
LQRHGRLHYEVWELRRLARGSRVLVVGGGDAAFDYALTLARRGCSSRIVLRSGRPRCLPLLAEYARRTSLIEVLPARMPIRLEEREGGARLTVRLGSARREEILEAERVLVAVGREPDLALAAGLDSAEDGAGKRGPGKSAAARGPEPDPWVWEGAAGGGTAARKAAERRAGGAAGAGGRRAGRPSAGIGAGNRWAAAASGERLAKPVGMTHLPRLPPGLFIAGDARHRCYRQLGIAVGEGILAAMAAADWLAGRGGEA